MRDEKNIEKMIEVVRSRSYGMVSSIVRRGPHCVQFING